MNYDAPGFSVNEVQLFLQENFGIQVDSITDVGSFDDQNFLAVDKKGQKLVLKVHNKNDSLDTLHMQNEVLRHLQTQTVPVQLPVVIDSLSGESIAFITDQQNINYAVRLLSYVDGTLLESEPTRSLAFWRDLGRQTSLIDQHLKHLSHGGAIRPGLAWDVQNLDSITYKLSSIKDIRSRRIVDYFLLQFDEFVRPLLHTLPRQIIHSDISRHAVTFDPANPDAVHGLFDFGDLVYSYRVMEIAVAIAYALLDQDRPLDICREIIAGYTENDTLTETEISVLYYLVAIRYCMYLLNSQYRADEAETNPHSQMKLQQMTRAIKRWIEINPLAAEDTFRRAARLPGLLEAQGDQYGEALALREQYVFKGLSLHYRKPVRIIKAALQYMYDDQGNSYLDCVNNVCQLGHVHPTVARAARRQITSFNTNSRYLYDIQGSYAKRLCEKLPAPLSVVMFVNSGSEANDLALRLAKTYTGKSDILVMEKAYHGNSHAITEISPNRIVGQGRPGLPEHVRSVELTDTLRGRFKANDPEAGPKYALSVKEKLDELQQEGRSACAFFCESYVGTGGQYKLPDGYLKAAYDYVRAAGALCIADEVQVGFGRTGNHFWCFEEQGVVPDIVTVGKPIANGHPMAAVITTPEIAAAFKNEIPYFNTFGGNPVSCTIGNAVLDVIEQEDILANVRQMSTLLRSGFEALKQKYDVISDVRAAGLYFGIEIVNGSDDLRPNGKLANDIIEELLKLGVFVNTNGDDKNILKIKPLLIIDEADCRRIVDSLDLALERLTGR